jgi:hypothetical protein
MQQNTNVHNKQSIPVTHIKVITDIKIHMYVTYTMYRTTLNPNINKIGEEIWCSFVHY